MIRLFNFTKIFFTKTYLFSLLFLLLFFSEAVCDEGRKNSFFMLQSNQITGMIPDIDNAYGVAFRDLNNDDHPDIYFTCFRNLNRMLINNGGIIPFIDRTIFSGTGGYLMIHGNVNLELGADIADYNNDGLPDLFIAGWGKTHRLFRNLGNVSFEDVTSNLNLLGTVDANQGLWFDADNDGFLDLYITDEHQSNRFLKNLQNGFFKEKIWTETFVDNAVSQGASNCDLDMDGDMDLYVSNWFSPDYLLINNGKGLFRRLKLNLPTLTQPISTNSSSFADIDNDGDPDLFVAGNNGYVYFYENQSDSTQIIFKERTNHPFYHIGNRVFGILIDDFNLDGWLDCFITTTGENRLYLNDGKGNFYNEYDSDKRKIYSTGASAADIDGDGDLDIIVSNKTDNSQLYLNPTNSQKYLRLKFLGVVSNRDAVGTKVFFYTTEDSVKKFLGYREVNVNTSYLSSKAPEIVFGTGNHTSVEVKAVFPSGVIIDKTYDSFGRTRTIEEYRNLTKAYYFSLKTIKFLAGRSDFWTNSFLVLFIILIIATYLFLGLKRYSWSSFNISFQLSIWFLISLFLFIFLKEANTYTILLTILSMAILSTIFLTLYSENFLRQRRKREAIHHMLNGLSDQIINIHDNQKLAEEVVNTFIKHPAIKNSSFYLMNADKTLEPCYSSSGNGYTSIKLNQNDEKILLNSRIKNINELNIINKLSDNANIILPAKRKGHLYGIITIFMPKSNSAINQEDLEQLSSIAGQSAIAIENNNYIKETASLIEQLTSKKIREEYVEKLEKTNGELDSKNKELEGLFRELQNKEAQLIHSEKMASLGQLVAGISHELNNPISFIYSNMKVITDYINDLSGYLSEIKNIKLQNKINQVLSEFREIIRDSENGSRILKDIVQNLKNFSRLDQAEWKEARLSEIIDSCLKIAKPQIPDTIRINLNLDADPVFFCNPGQLNQVFLNLITNAFQAIKNDGVIQISSNSTKEILIIEITDNGPGIPGGIIKKIFDPFFTTKPVNKGTGLGLSISYSIIQKHKGELSVKSTKNSGTTFTIKIPLNLERVHNNA